MKHTILPPAEYHQLDAEPPRRSFARGLVNSLAIYGVALLLWSVFA